MQSFPPNDGTISFITIYFVVANLKIIKLLPDKCTVQVVLNMRSALY